MMSVNDPKATVILPFGLLQFKYIPELTAFFLVRESP